jgi:hypothetical protein
MRFHTRLAAIDWKYTFRELVLIIAGILIALWLSDWNARRHQRSAEVVLLREMRAALEADIAQVRTVAESLRVSEQRTASLRDYIRSPQPYADSLAVLFGSAYGFRLSQLNTAPYEALKVRGLQLVSDDALRVPIIRVYEIGAAEIRRADDIITNISYDVLRPYYLARFRDIQFLEHATPLDYPAVASDPYFHNLLDYRLTVLRRGVLSRYDEAIAAMAHLIDAIDRELGDRE